MQLSDIPAHLGISAKHLSDLMGVTRQALNNYTSGRKGKPSNFIIQLLAVSNLNQIEIIFPNVFDHPNGENSDCAAHWANVAIEALQEAKKRGVEVEAICKDIMNATTPTLSNFD